MNDLLTQAILNALKTAIEKYVLEFPTAVAKLQEDFGPDLAEMVPSIVTTLEADPDLIAQTETETNIANLIKTVLPIVLSAVKTSFF